MHKTFKQKPPSAATTRNTSHLVVENIWSHSAKPSDCRWKFLRESNHLVEIERWWKNLLLLPKMRPWTVHHFIEKHVKHAVTSVQLDWEKFGLQKNIHVVSLVTQLIRTIQNPMFIILYLGPFTKQSTTLVRMSGCIHDYPCLWWDAHAPNILVLISSNTWMCFPGQQTSAVFIRLCTTYWMEQWNWTIGTISLYCTWLSAVALIPLGMYSWRI